MSIVTGISAGDTAGNSAGVNVGTLTGTQTGTLPAQQNNKVSGEGRFASKNSDSREGREAVSDERRDLPLQST